MEKQPGKRPLIGVVTARVAEKEQRMLLGGIMHRAEQLGMDVAVFSNIYNFQEYFAGTQVENRIYELAGSPRIDGLILTAESILNPELQQQIYKIITERGVPVVVNGAELPGMTCLNNDVVQDFDDIGEHVAGVYGFTEVDFLTGYKEVETSHQRAQGLRRALQRHGAELPEENIIYGDFWMFSGEKLALDYIEGRRRWPQAVVCANDYMAYGICDKLLEYGIHVPEQVTIIGYEHVGERYYHMPILTTYFRNRYALGEASVNKLWSMITGAPEEPVSVAGEMICGSTCTCGIDIRNLSTELSGIRRHSYYMKLNFEANFEQQLTVCRSVQDYIQTLQEFSYLIRDCVGLYLCLYETWADAETDAGTDRNQASMLCYRIISPENGGDAPQYFVRNRLYPEHLSGMGFHPFLYFAPIFFAGREMGYFLMGYDKPDSYDTVFGDWLKVAANGLEALRMKNDIHALLECQNLSEHHDTTTGLWNRIGFRDELNLICSHAAPEAKVMLVLLRTAAFMDDASIDGQSTTVRMEGQIAKVLKSHASGQGELCGKLSDRLFAFAAVGDFDETQAAILEDKLETLVLHTPLYQEHFGLGTLICAHSLTPAAGADAELLVHDLYPQISTQMQQLGVQRSNASFAEYSALRNSMFRSPQSGWNAQETCRDFHLSYGHFRATYRELFGVSFHQDFIWCRLSMAKHLLLTTNLSLQAIAFQCGYEDDKYFLRQFRQITGCTPNVYRSGS